MEGAARWLSPGYSCRSKKPSAQMLFSSASFLSQGTCFHIPWLSVSLCASLPELFLAQSEFRDTK